MSTLIANAEKVSLYYKSRHCSADAWDDGLHRVPLTVAYSIKA